MMIPSIDISKGRAVQLIGGKIQVLDAGDPVPLLKKFARLGEVAVVDLDAARSRGHNQHLIQQLVRQAPIRVSGGIRNVKTALEWLDAGARRIVMGTAATPEILAQLPRERVFAALDVVGDEVVVDGWETFTGRKLGEAIAELSPFVSGFQVTFVEIEGTCSGIPWSRAKALKKQLGAKHLTVAGGLRDASEVGLLDRMGVDVQVGMALYTNRLTLGEALRSTLAPGVGALWPTVVVNEHEQALGLVWSSERSLDASLERGQGIYESRRRGLWVKGETSGATQELLAVEVDCDRDALRFRVRQKPPGFCHLNRASCWSLGTGLFELEQRLRILHRERTVAGSSYTQKLFADPEFLRSKICEEAKEFAQAHTKTEIVHEAADLFYFALTKLVGEGVPMEKVEAELDRRAQRVRRRDGSPTFERSKP